MNDTKLHILKEAFILFLQKSFKEVTMKEIVEKTGLSKGAFYHYFESKEQLFHEVINTFYMSLQNEAITGFEARNLKDFYTNYLKKLTGMLESLKETTTKSGTDINYLGLAFDAMRLVPGYRDQIKESHKEEQAQWESVIKKARASGEIESNMTDEQLARLFIYINDGVGMHLILEGRVGDIIGEIFSLYNALYQQLSPKK